MPFEPKSPTMVKKMKKGEMFEHISELYNVIDSIHKEEVKWRKDALHFRTAHMFFLFFCSNVEFSTYLYKSKYDGARSADPMTPYTVPVPVL